MTSWPHELMTSWPHNVMTGWPDDIMTSLPHDIMTSSPHDLMTPGPFLLSLLQSHLTKSSCLHVAVGPELSPSWTHDFLAS
jgi:hypothetical protein